ncbi:MAG: glycoside hydrolase family 3 N-terminal domain-containing protein [Schleiferiaceae bacterium]
MAQLTAQPVFDDAASAAYADSVLLTLDNNQKLGQLFMVAAYSNRGPEHVKQIEKLVQDEALGGLIFFQGGPVRQARLTNHYQEMADIPLMIGMDAEWGLAMRLDSTFAFPWALTAGAVQDSALLYEMGLRMAAHCKRLGVHVSFSPVVDVNTNPDNPIINARALGENAEDVSHKARWIMQGLQDGGVLACAKHFPGHGDTDGDSHKTLPTVNHSAETLKAQDLKPYEYLIPRGLGSVMVAHLNVPSIDEGTPTSLSPVAVNQWLKTDYGFKGLIFTDALNMKGVSAYYKPGEVDAKALVAGNDILLFSEDVSTAKKMIEDAIRDSLITWPEIENRVRKILRAKYWMGLQRTPVISTDGLVADLNTTEDEVLNKKLYEAAATVISNKDKTLPIVETQSRIAVVTMGSAVSDQFSKTCKEYMPVESFSFEPGMENTLLSELSDYDQVIVAFYSSNANPWKSYKYAKSQKRFLKKLALQNKYVLAHFANPYGLKDQPFVEDAQAIVIGYQNHPDAERGVAQIIFGALSARGRLPVSVSDLLDNGYGLKTGQINRLRYGYPEEVGLERADLAPIDSIVNYAIADEATPGAQILIAKDGVVFYQKSFGFHTYDHNIPVTNYDLYDVASITKISATMPLIMEMYEDGIIDLDMPLATYLPEVGGTNKADISVREMMAHQAGLEAWIPFYLNTLVDQSPDPTLYKTKRSAEYPLQVADELYITRDYTDTIYQAIYDSPLGRKKYKYSDLGYYLLKKVIEKHYRKPMSVLTREKFYEPIGAYSMGYHPLERFTPKQIVPTEYDKYFRYQLVHGYVHDQGAAMMGGVGGHAGIFANANDLAKLMQMYLNGGVYGNVKYLESSTLDEFTRCQYCENDNRRGIGFDKPQLDEVGPTCGCVSMASFGHTGFTGTMAWVDPDTHLIYIFLSNRINPSAENRKLISGDYRTKIQEVIYEAIHHAEETNTATARH